MQVLLVLLVVVVYKFIVLDKLSLFLYGLKNGNRIVFMIKFSKIEKVDYILWY